MSAPTSPTDVADAHVHLDEQRHPPALVLRGSISTARAAELHAAALRLDALDAAIDIDCAEVEHLGLAALQILIALRRALAQRGHAAALIHLPEPIATLLVDTGFATPLGLLPRAER